MFRKLFRLPFGHHCYRLFLGAGCLLAAWGLKGLGQAAVFVHETVRVPAVVTDVTQKPFESPLAALCGGNWKAEVAYYPHVSYSIPGGISQNGWRLPDADALDHRIGEQVEILTMPQDPTTAHLAAWKFIWGKPTLLFGGGVALILFGQLLRGRKGRRVPKPAPTRRETPRAEEKAPRRTQKRGQMELGLEVEEAPAKPKRQRKAATGGAAKTPRKRQKKEV